MKKGGVGEDKGKPLKRGAGCSDDTPMRLLTAVMQAELMSSWGAQTAMLRWPRPMVYFPGVGGKGREEAAAGQCQWDGDGAGGTVTR